MASLILKQISSVQPYSTLDPTFHIQSKFHGAVDLEFVGSSLVQDHSMLNKIVHPLNETYTE